MKRNALTIIKPNALTSTASIGTSPKFLQQNFIEDPEIEIPPYIQRVLDRLIFLKLKQMIYKITNNFTMDTLKRISPKLWQIAREKTDKLEVRFRLFGELWPPVIVYSAKVYSFRDTSVGPSVMPRVSVNWKVLFTDKPVFIQRAIREGLSPGHKKSFSMERGYRLPTLNLSRIGATITYNWKTMRQKVFESRPDVKYKKPSFIRPVFNETLAISEEDIRKEAKRRLIYNKYGYRAFWTHLAVAQLLNKINLNSSFI